jgi:hypothetical protein
MDGVPAPGDDDRLRLPDIADWRWGTPPRA